MTLCRVVSECGVSRGRGHIPEQVEDAAVSEAAEVDVLEDEAPVFPPEVPERSS